MPSALDQVSTTLFLPVTVLLFVAGSAKIRNPFELSRVLSVIGLPSGLGIVRVIGLAEVGLSSAGFLHPRGFPVLGVCAVYLGFAVFLTAILILRIPIPSCGCVGAEDAPPGPLHVGINLAAASIAALVWVGGDASYSALVADGGWQAPILAVGVLGAVYFIYVWMSLLPTALSTSRTPRNRFALPMMEVIDGN